MQLTQQSVLLEQKDALLGEQSATIRQQESRLEAQQLEINRLLQQAFGRRSERYLESPQQLKLDFGGGSEVSDAADGLQQAVDERAGEDDARSRSPVIGGKRRSAMSRCRRTCRGSKWSWTSSRHSSTAISMEQRR